MKRWNSRALVVATFVAIGAAVGTGFALGGNGNAPTWTTHAEGLLAVPSPCCTDATIWRSLDEISDDGQRPRPASAAEAAAWIDRWPHAPRGELAHEHGAPLEVRIKNSEVRCTGTPSGPEIFDTGNDVHTLEAVRLRNECVFTKWRVWSEATAETRLHERHTVWAGDDGFFRGRVDYWE